MRRRTRRALERAVRDWPPGRRVRTTAARRALLDRFGRLAPVRLLDAGCEDALLVTQLARLCPAWRFVGLDRNLAGLSEGYAWLADEPPDVAGRIQLAQADLGALPVGPGTFDAAVILDVLTLITDDGGVVAGLAEALRPGGVLVVTVMQADWTPLLPGARTEWPGIVRHGYTDASLTALLEGAGLHVEEIRAVFGAGTQLAQDTCQALGFPALRVRLATWPVFAGVAALDGAGLDPGKSRAFVAVARKP